MSILTLTDIYVYRVSSLEESVRGVAIPVPLMQGLKTAVIQFENAVFNTSATRVRIYYKCNINKY